MIRTLAACAAIALASCSFSTFAANSSDPAFVPQNAGGTVPAGGGSCATPVNITALPFSQAGNSCGGTNNINDYDSPACLANLAFPYPGPEDVWAITVGAGNALNVSASLTGSTGDLALFLVGTCGSGTSCIATSQDAIGAGEGPEQIDPADMSGLAAGTYYVYVDSYYGTGAASCGTYTLSVTGTLPVSLEAFSID